MPRYVLRAAFMKLTLEHIFWSIVVVFVFLNFGVVLRTDHNTVKTRTHVERFTSVHSHSNLSLTLAARPTKIHNVTTGNAVSTVKMDMDGFDLAQHARRMCHFNKTSFSLTQWLHDVNVIRSKNAIICPVEKVASTFWRRVMYLAENTGFEKKHPYQIPVTLALKQTFKYLTGGNDVRINNSFSFLFVRDPYHRVLSAYIDKVFSPNPMFWEKMGKPAITKFRTNGSSSAVKNCYHDATFAEFIQFVVWSEREKQLGDTHFLQASEKCQPCFANYTFIGKMESFQQDAAYIFNRFGMRGANKSLTTNMKALSEQDAIQDSLSGPFYWRRAIEKCMPWPEALKRVWKKLQMRGLIETDIVFPLEQPPTNVTGVNVYVNPKNPNRSRYTKLYIKYNSRSEFSKLAIDAWKRSDPQKLKEQKQRVFVEMYGQLSSELLESFRKAYSDDFTLFNYPDRPAALSEMFKVYNP